MNHSSASHGVPCTHNEGGGRRRLPVPLEMSSAPQVAAQWLMAARRASAYLSSFGYEPGQRSQILAQVLRRVASQADWASGHRIVALVMRGLQIWFIEQTGLAPVEGEVVQEGAVARARLLAEEHPMEVNLPPAGRWHSFPRVRRRRMVAAERPVGQRLRLRWRLIRRHGR